MRRRLRPWCVERHSPAWLGRCLAVIALLGQILLPVTAFAQPVATGETLVVCTPQGFRTVAVDPAAPERPDHHHRCDFCCLGHCTGQLLAVAVALAIPLGDAAPAADAWPEAVAPMGAPRFGRPQGRAPPLHLV